MTTTTSTSRRSSSDATGAAPIVVRCSTRADGDFHLTRRRPVELERTRRAFVDLPWTMLDQTHGIEVVRVTEPGGRDRSQGDVVITDVPDAVLGVWVADCAPIVLVGAEREFAVVHAGWRGLAAGVIDAAVESFTEPIVELVLGPTIGPCCYEFGADDLLAVAAGVHATTAELCGRTTTGGRALDVPAAVSSAARHHDIAVRRIGSCTGCSYDGFSHRAGRDPERHVVAAWRPSGGAAS